MNATTVKLTVRQWASEDRPSNKLQNLGTAALSDSELLAILVGSGTSQHNAVEIGQQIMSRFDHSLSKLAKADFRDIKDIEGVGTYTACKILAAIELGKRRQLATALMAPDLCTATAIYNYMNPKMQDLQVEEGHVILLNQNYKLIKSVRISQGGITETSVDIRIIMKEAVVNNATIIVFCHNHPSGSICPSRVDDELTRSIKRACDLMRIHFCDHVIIGDCQYYSYREQGKL
ncbi:MAG: DNA repair protein RadC [Prevotella sp.]|nr:DNA repair protein RadC [Prevotella sp.]